MRIRSWLAIAAFAALNLTILLGLRAQQGPAQPRLPGPAGGYTQLPNGWRIAPAGRHLKLGNLPLAMVNSPDGKYVLVTTNGYLRPSLLVVSTEYPQILSEVQLDHAWLGLAWNPDGRHLYTSGANKNHVKEFLFDGGKATLQRTFALPALPDPKEDTFVGGVAPSPDGRALFVVRVFAQTVSRIDLKTGQVSHTVPLAAEPYTCVTSLDGRTLYVSLWGGAKVLAFDAETLTPLREMPVGEHPSAMALSKDGARLFVACANTNAVWALDLASGRTVEQLATSLYPDSPAGTTPNGLGLSPDGRTLLVANADNNDIAVVDVSTPGKGQTRGFIPTGWYPTAAMFSPDGRTIYSLSGKGLSSMANPNGPSPGRRRPDNLYAGNILLGALSMVPTPDESTLAAMSTRVRELTPYSDRTRLAPANAPGASPIPRRVGEPSPIKHVFYVIRENRTYDQVLGDLKQGNGDPTLTLFGAEVTPNAHKLVGDFTLFDNFYVDAEVSYDGHAYSTGAYATDVVEKLWPTNYADRGGPYLGDGGGHERNAYGNLAAPPQGYLWDFCRRAGVSVRSYGEFVRNGSAEAVRSAELSAATVPGLRGLFNEAYPSYDLRIPDQKRADVWLAEFREFEQNGKLPALSIIRLPNDHTNYTTPGFFTPSVYVADNDLALGRIVEAISNSRYWKESAIFVVEDDAQSGPDHVDAHRSVLLTISPFVRRGHVDHTMYSTASVLRTIELILGLPPMSQYDAAATPAYNAFQATPVLTPFAHVEARIRLDDKNPQTAYGAERSKQFYSAEADRVPDVEGNEILWKAIKGADSVMPPPRRAAFIRPLDVSGDDDDDDDK